MSEAKLISRARRGDEGAWELLVRRHQEPAFRMAYLLLSDADEAEDVTQEAFIRAFRSLSRFDSTRPLRPWLLRIVTNLARNRRRAIGRYMATLQRLVRIVPESGTREVPEGSLYGGDAEILWQAIRRLRSTDQQVIYLRFFLELSVKETAEIVGVAPGTVKSRLSRALERLRQLIEREYPSLWKERVV